MVRRLIGCSGVLLLLVSLSSAATDPFLGTWTADVQKMRQAKGLPLGALGESVKVEAYKSGYKLTHMAGGYSWIITVDFATGATAVRDNKGQEIGRVKLVRKSAVEIESTDLDTGLIEDYRILPGGNEIEITIRGGDIGTPPLTAYYKRTS